MEKCLKNKENRIFDFINDKHSENVVNLNKSLYSPVTIQYGAPSHGMVTITGTCVRHR